MPGPGSAIVRHVVTFGRVLREAGIEVGPGRLVDAVRGLSAVELTRQDDAYFTLRQTLVSRHEELELFDRAFSAWFLRGAIEPPARGPQLVTPQRRPAPTLVGRADADDDRSREPLDPGASAHELLREQ